MNRAYQETNLKTRRKIYSVVISLFIIFITGILINYGMCEMCFFLHFIPWAIGFSEGYTISFFIYYIILFVVLSLIIYLIIRPKNNQIKIKK